MEMRYTKQEVVKLAREVLGPDVKVTGRRATRAHGGYFHAAVTAGDVHLQTSEWTPSATWWAMKMELYLLQESLDQGKSEFKKHVEAIRALFISGLVHPQYAYKALGELAAEARDVGR